MKLICLVALMAASRALAGGDAPLPPRPVVSEVVTLRPDDRNSYVGTVISRVETDLGFPLAGTVAERPVDVGDQLARGDVLARLDPQDLDTDLRTAEAGVAVARAQLRSARDAQRRAAELVKRGSESDTRLEETERALTAAEARLEQAQAALKRAQDLRGFAQLNAPHDGVVTEVFAEPGATLSTGDPVLRLASTAQREIVIDLSERSLAALDIGARFDAALAANPDVTTRVTLSRIDPVANRTTRTRRLRFALEDPPPSFRLGALVRLNPASGDASSISLPLSAILGARSDAPAVWVVDRADNTVSRREVTLGARFGDSVRITSGVEIGDEVVLRGIHSLTDGQTVGGMVTR